MLTVFYELITGCRAFDDESVHETMRRVGDCEWEWPKGTASTVLHDVVTTCLQKNPKDRYHSAAEVYRVLRNVEDSFTPLQLRTQWPEA